MGIVLKLYVHTADFIKKVLSVYTHSMTTIYLFLRAQVAKSTFFMKSPLYEKAVEILPTISLIRANILG